MTPRLVSIVLMIIGIILFCYSFVLPYYKDQKAASNLLVESYSMNKNDYYKQEAALRTNKTTFMDVGAGLTIAAVSILLFLIQSKIKTVSDYKTLQTFKNKTDVFVSNLVWLLLIPGTFWYYYFRGVRGDYPPFADSIGIPLMEQIPTILFALIPLNLFLLFTIRKTSLPAKLFIKPAYYNAPIILWEVFFGFWLLLSLLCLILFIMDGDHFSIPVNLFFTYILLTLRAG